MNLSTAQRSFFREQGYVRIEGGVSQALVRAARRAINLSIGRGMNEADMPRLRVQSFCPELRAHPVIMALLLESGIWALGESLIGAGQVRPGSQGDAQINLRFPVEEQASLSLEPHLDGMESRSNAVPEGQIRNFTALVGVMLSDQLAENEGNFTVWPGSHQLNASYLRRAGPQSLLQGMPKVDLSEPVQLTGSAGDVLLAHYLLSHGTSPNWGSDVRYMVFFRLTHVRHDEDQWRSLVEPWLQWPGIGQTDPFSAGGDPGC